MRNHRTHEEKPKDWAKKSQILRGKKKKGESLILKIGTSKFEIYIVGKIVSKLHYTNGSESRL